jgi:hypothetical protein
MRLSFLLLLCASGCDLVIPLSEPPVSPCGPFGKPVAQTFDAGLLNGMPAPDFVDVKYFSARNAAKAGDPDYGAIHAKREGNARVYVVERTDTNAWTYAPTRNALLGGTAGGSIGEIEFDFLPNDAKPGVDRLFVWQATPTSMYQAELITTMGGGYAIENAPAVTDREFNIEVGNVVEVLEADPDVPGAMRPQRKRAVVTKTPVDFSGKPVIVFADLLFPYASHVWAEDDDRTQPINKDPLVVPGRGALTNDLFILVYSMKYANGSYDIYASRRDPNTRQWSLGEKVTGEVNTSKLDETDPWINGDCSVLYFARNGVTYRADRTVDE